MKIGRRSSLDFKVFIKFPWLVEIGASTSVNRGCEFYPDSLSKSSIYLGDKVRLGPNVRLYASGHDLESEGYEDHIGGNIRILDGAWIGANTIILPDVTVGQFSVVAAGSVVTKDIPDYHLVAGVPAKIVRSLLTCA